MSRELTTFFQAYKKCQVNSPLFAITTWSEDLLVAQCFGKKKRKNYKLFYL